MQRTTWNNAERALGVLREHELLDPAALASVKPHALASLVRPAGFANSKAAYLHALATFFVQSGGVEVLGRDSTRRLRNRLLEIRGVGPETADSILLYAFERPVWIADAYAGRLFSRLWDLRPDVEHQHEMFLPWIVAGRTADLQEMHALIVAHGKQRCRARPLCGECPLFTVCRHGVATKAALR